MAGSPEMLATMKQYTDEVMKTVNEIKEQISKMERHARMLWDDRKIYPCSNDDIKKCEDLLKTHGKFNDVMKFLNTDEKTKDDEDFKISIKNAYNVIVIDKQIVPIQDQIRGLYKQLGEAEEVYNQKMKEGVDAVHAAWPEIFTISKKGNTEK